MSKRNNVIERIYICMYLFFFFGVLVFASMLDLMDTNREKKGITIENFEKKWIYTYGDGIKGETYLPEKIDESESRDLILYNNLPSIKENGDFIFNANNSFARITIGDKVVYDKLTLEKEKNEWCTLKNTEYISIPLDVEDSGKSIVIELYSSVSRYLSDVGEAYILYDGDLELRLFKEGYLTLACLVVFLTLAVVLGTAWLVIFIMFKKNLRELLFLCLFIISVTLWLSTEASIVQYVLQNTRGPSMIAFEMLMLMPVPMVLFCKEMSMRNNLDSGTAFALIPPIILFVMNNTLHHFEILSLPSSLRASQIVLVGEIIYVGYFQITEYLYIKKQDNDIDIRLRRFPLVGISIVVPLGVYEVIKFLLWGGGKTNNGVLISIGLAFYVCSLAMDAVAQYIYKSMKYQQSAETKTQFLANMSHEIRTPLNAMLGFNEAILQNNRDEKVQKYALNIQQAGNNLKGIINSILDISKIEAGKLEIASMEYNMLFLLNNLVNMMSELAKKKGLQVYTDIDSQIPEILIGDEQHLRQVLINIMNNAVKYTNQGSVTLSARLLEKKSDSPTCIIRFSVKDTGVGIKDEDRAKLYEKFERLGAEKNSNAEGTGLGMSIVMQTLRAMNSEIKLESTYGVGSEFFFELEQCVVSQAVIGNFEERRKEVALKQSDSSDFIAPDAHILVVDDVEMNLDAIVALLELTKINIDTAMSGKEAIEKVKNNKYDIIFMDHMMPEMDGIEATQIIRNLAVETKEVYYATVPIIAFTANAMVGMKEQFQLSGMQDFVSKPVEINVLKNMIIKWLPKELIITDIDKSESETIQTTERTDDEWNICIEEIDIDEAKKYSANFKGFEKSIATFYKAHGTNKEEIVQYAEAGDISNYVIKVHGLKSTSKMIGAMKLSKKAKELEAEGNEGNLSLEETDNLIELYDRCVAAIGKYLGKYDNGGNSTDTDVITEEEYTSILERIKKAAQEFNASELMELEDEIQNIRVPPEKEEEFKKISNWVSNLAFGEISEYFG